MTRTGLRPAHRRAPAAALPRLTRAPGRRCPADQDKSGAGSTDLVRGCLALAHPNVVPLLVTRPLSGPLAQRPLGTLRPLEELLEVFITAGFDPHGALHAARLFTGFLYAHVQHELQERVHDPEETEDLLRLGLHRLPITQFPRLRSLAPILAGYDGAAELDEGLAIVLAGLRSQLLS